MTHSPPLTSVALACRCGQYAVIAHGPPIARALAFLCAMRHLASCAHAGAIGMAW